MQYASAPLLTPSPAPSPQGVHNANALMGVRLTQIVARHLAPRAGHFPLFRTTRQVRARVNFVHAVWVSIRAVCTPTQRLPVGGGVPWR